VTTAQYPVNASPFQVFQAGQGQPRYGLTNTGSTILYLSSGTQTNSTDGWPLNPSATVPWPAATALSVVCATTGTLQTIDADVGLFDPGAVAQQLNLIGVPAIDQPTVIASRTLTGPTAVASGTVPPQLGPIDVRRYQTVFISGQETALSGSSTRTMTLTWSSDASGAGGSVLAVDSIDTACAQGMWQLQRPIRGAYLTITWTAATTPNPVSQFMNVFGSLRTQTARTLLSSLRNNTTGLLVPPNDATKGITVWSGTITGVGTTKLEYPNALMGCQATMTFRTTATLDNIMALDLQSYALQSYTSWEITNAVPFIHETLWLPPIPLQLSLLNFSSGTPDFLITLTTQPQ